MVGPQIDAPAEGRAQGAPEDLDAGEAEPVGEAHAGDGAGEDLDQDVRVQARDDLVAAPGPEDQQRQGDAQGYADGAGDGGYDVDEAGKGIQMNQVPQAVGGAETGDQQHDHADGDAALMVDQTQPGRKQDQQLHTERDGEIQDQRIALLGRETADQKADQGRGRRGRQTVQPVAAEKDAEGRTAQDHRQISQPALGLRRGPDLLHPGGDGLVVRLFGADPAGQGVEPGERIEVDRSAADLAELGQHLAFGIRGGGLDVGGNHPDVAVRKSHGGGHTVDRILYPVGLSAAANHLRPGVQDLRQSFFVIQKASSPLWNSGVSLIIPRSAGIFNRIPPFSPGKDTFSKTVSNFFRKKLKSSKKYVKVYCIVILHRIFL